MTTKPIITKENSFDGAPGGMAGSLNYQTPIGTHASPSTYQDPLKPNTVDYNTSYDKLSDPNDPIHTLDGSGSFDAEVDKLFNKKEKPTIDDVEAGLQYEMGHMSKKNKSIAKARVIDNLTKYGPKYYTKLQMLGLTDKDITTSLAEEVKTPMQHRLDILNAKIKGQSDKHKKHEPNDRIKDILNQKLELKRQMSAGII